MIFDIFRKKGHQSAGGIILTPENKIVLVCQHGNSWSFPKGHVEEGESLRGAAAREIAEEAGITELEFICDLGSYERYSISLDGKGENRDWGMRKRTLFLFRSAQGVLVPHDPDGEVTEVRTVTLDEALQLLTHEKDKAFLNSVRPIIERYI